MIILYTLAFLLILTILFHFRVAVCISIKSRTSACIAAFYSGTGTPVVAGVHVTWIKSFRGKTKYAALKALLNKCFHLLKI